MSLWFAGLSKNAGLSLQSVLQSRSAGCRYQNILACDEQNADAPYFARGH
jgi:hypothetical protein